MPCHTPRLNHCVPLNVPLEGSLTSFGRKPGGGNAGRSIVASLSFSPAFLDSIRIRGARTHNLKNLSLELPRNRLVVITGLSGSGKSSLAVSYTHLRAHETPEHLVCRLLLE